MIGAFINPGRTPERRDPAREMMRWLWRDDPVSTDPHDMVERSSGGCYPKLRYKIDRRLVQLIRNLEHLDISLKIAFRLKQGDGTARKIYRVPLFGSAVNPLRRVFEGRLSLIQTAQRHAGYIHR